MNTWSILWPMLRADFQERTRRSSFWIILCLVVYLGYAVNTGGVLILLDIYRGIYNSAWVGSLMSLVITFFLGIFGFFLVKNTIQRDEQTGVGQIIAATSLNRSQYLLGKWLSNFAVLASLTATLALAAILMQLVHREDAQPQLWALVAPFLFIAMPMMALISALAVFFETVRWLKGGFGNIAYFFVFIFLFVVGVQLEKAPWLDITGFSLIGPSMKAAARATFPAYDGSFMLGMAGGKALATFVWQGLDWTPGLIGSRLAWFGVSLVIALAGSLFFNRFDPTSQTTKKHGQKLVVGEDHLLGGKIPECADAQTTGDDKTVQLSRLETNLHFHTNFFRLVWLECLLLVKGLKWYWIAGMAVLWVGCLLAPAEGMRKYWYMMAVLWPVLVWSKMGEREERYQTGQLIYHAPHMVLRLTASGWLAGVLVSATATGGVLLGRLVHGEAPEFVSWALSMLFIPTLALALGSWSRSSKVFEVVYPILWFLGPFNAQNSLASLDYLGIHAQAPVNTSPLLAAGGILLLALMAGIGRMRQAIV